MRLYASSCFKCGHGFTPPMKRYFDRWQRKLGLDETVVPLDAVNVFEAAVASKDP